MRRRPEAFAPPGRDEEMIAAANASFQKADESMKAYLAVPKDDPDYAKKRGTFRSATMKHVGLAWIQMCAAYKEAVPSEKVELFRNNLRILNKEMPGISPVIEDIINLHNRINTKALEERNKMTGGLISLAYNATAGGWSGAGGLGKMFVSMRAEQGSQALRDRAQDLDSAVALSEAYDAIMNKLQAISDAVDAARL